jgi:hypothetical protein
MALLRLPVPTARSIPSDALTPPLSVVRLHRASATRPGSGSSSSSPRATSTSPRSPRSSTCPSPRSSTTCRCSAPRAS